MLSVLQDASWVLWICSTTTIASSMIRPKAAAIAPRVIILKVCPVKYKTSKVAQSVTGITIKIVALALTDFKIK
jgi:uncharacterized metal-binding protein